MNNAETLTTALANLATHKLRTALTMLGMIFGVGAVIAMLSIGAGGEKKALEAIGRLGLRNVIVKAKVVKPDETREEYIRNLQKHAEVDEPEETSGDDDQGREDTQYRQVTEEEFRANLLKDRLSRV